VLAILLAVVAPSGMAADWITHSANDFGATGLLQNPTARMAPDGEFKFGVSTVYPYNGLFAGIQLTPWLETSLRYTEVRNRRYGDPDFSGDQTNKDRGVDFKVRLLAESRYLPELALGMRDVGGTGLFSSEYLVASRRVGDFDLTFGLGWGRLGTRGGIRNPLAALSDRFEDRPGEGTVDKETIGVDRWFSGEEIGVFGGVEWQTPIDALTVKLEYDGNDYQHEALENDREVDSPINVALNYRAGRILDLSAGIERGNTFMARIAILTNLQNGFGPDKILDAPATSQLAGQDRSKFAALRAKTTLDPERYEALKAELARQRIDLRALDLDDSNGTATVWYDQRFAREPARAVKRLGETLALMLPERYQAFVLVSTQGDTELARLQMRRDDVDRELAYLIEPEDLVNRIGYADVEPVANGLTESDYPETDRYFHPSWNMGPALRQHVGGPDDFYFGQLWWRIRAGIDLTPRWDVSSVVGIDIYNNFDGLKNRPSSSLPHVRSDVVRYIKEGQNNLVRLETNYRWSPARNWYTRFSAGIFEEMYGGVAAEVLYREPYSPWAVGVNVNRVRKRDFDQRFDFLDYEVTTGHLTGYFELPWYDMSVKASVGRYLAGDVGGTLEVARRFKNGVVAGVFATKTDVPASEFGEGSFDKGFTLVIPLDVFFVRSSRRVTSFLFRPLTRDGGQKVRDGDPLYYWTNSGTYRSPDDGWFGSE